VIDVKSGELKYRIRDGQRVVDVNSGETKYRVRD
jgi:hypothetical protein